MYVEPLDPANLDRFALQVQSDGLIVSNDWEAVSQVVDMYHKWEEGRNGSCSKHDNDGSADSLAEAAKAVGSIDITSVEIGDDAKECFVLFLQWLSNHAAVTSRNSLLSDRTFLVKAPRILRAQAMLEGRSTVIVEDLKALRHMTTFRVPAQVHQQVCELLLLLSETSPDDVDDDSDDDDETFGRRRKKDGNNLAGYLKSVIQRFDEGGQRISGSRSSSESEVNMHDDQEADAKENESTSKSKPKTREDSSNDIIDHELLADVGGIPVLHATVSSFMKSTKEMKEQTIMRPIRRLWGSFQGPQIKLNLHASAVSGAESVMNVLNGRSRRSRASASLRQLPELVGQPRERGRIQSMTDPNLLLDADAADISSWLTTPTSSLPRGLLRHPKKRGGTIVLARDISDSMWGPRAALASATTQAAIALARRRGMRFGYCEFAGMPKFYHQRPPGHARDQGAIDERYDMDAKPPQFVDAFIEWGSGMTNQIQTLFGFKQCQANAESLTSSGHFFGVDYSFCERRSKQLETDGYTNLQEMLRQLLERFSVSGLPPHERHLVIITDGSPTTGSTTCTDEAMLAKSLGVSIHPIFVVESDELVLKTDGDDHYPKVLTYLAEETNGVRFLAKHEVSLDERAEIESSEYAHLVRVKVELA